jgi:hypothetical protein
MYLIYNLTLGHYGGAAFKDFRQGTWWQYLIIVGLLILSFLFGYAGKIESVVFDKTKDEFK